ncbi:entericidin A/B family lipoprotein [Roseovarius sp. D22-M7]
MKSIMTLVLACLVLTGCNTVQGAGQDIETAGQTIEDAAE